MDKDLTRALNGSIIALKHSIDKLIDVLQPSLKLAPDGGQGHVSYYDPEAASAADELRMALAHSGLTAEQIENLVEKYIIEDTVLDVGTQSNASLIPATETAPRSGFRPANWSPEEAEALLP